MKPTWLIERGVYRDHASAFKAEAKRQGMACLEVDYRPGKPAPDDITGTDALADDACVILRGTLPLMQQIHLHRKWRPGGWCNVENLACSNYYRHFGQFLLNRDHRLLTGVEALRRQEELYSEFGLDDVVFVRPSSVHKSFTGTVVHQDDFCDAIAPARYDDQTFIVVSSPKEIDWEWRLAIAGDEILAASQYRDHGAFVPLPGCPADVKKYTQAMLQQVRWRPDNVFIADICSANGELHLLELNSFSCSGLYACNLEATIRGASAISEDLSDSPP